MKRWLSFLAAFLFAAPAFAAHYPFPPQAGSHRFVDLDDIDNANPLLDNVDLTTTRSFTLPINRPSSMGALLLWVDYTYATDGDVFLTCKAGRKSSTGSFKQYTITGCKVLGDGTCETQSSASFKMAGVTGNRTEVFRLNILGFSNVTCDASHTAGAAGDKLTVEGDLIAQ